MIKIKDRKGMQTSFSKMARGSTFDYSDEFYIKIRASGMKGMAIKLSKGTMHDFHEEELVLPVDIIAEVEYK